MAGTLSDFRRVRDGILTVDYDIHQRGSVNTLFIAPLKVTRGLDTVFEKKGSPRTTITRHFLRKPLPER